jgi:hypothetical protein
MKTSEIVEKSRKSLKIIRKHFLKFLEFLKEHKIALIALCISVIGSSPITSRFLIYYLYEPKIKIGMAFGGTCPFNGKTTFNSLEVLDSTLNIVNTDIKRNMRIEIEFIASKPIKINPQFEGYFREQGLGGGGFRFVTNEFYLPAHSTLGLGYPFELYYEEFTLEVIIYPKMKMSEFGLPRFFGDIDLRPVKKTFVIEF